MLDISPPKLRDRISEFHIMQGYWHLCCMEQLMGYCVDTRKICGFTMKLNRKASTYQIPYYIP